MQLGRLIRTRDLMVTIPDCKREKIIKLLKHWHEDREAFAVMQTARLVGALIDMALVCPWAVFTFISLQDSLRRALRKNRTRQQDESSIQSFHH